MWPVSSPVQGNLDICWVGVELATHVVRQTVHKERIVAHEGSPRPTRSQAARDFCSIETVIWETWSCRSHGRPVTALFALVCLALGCC